MPSCVGVDSSPRLGGRGPRPSSLPHILSDHRRPPVAGSVAPGSGGRWRGGRFVLGGPCTGRFSHTKWATQIRPLTGPQGTLVGRPTAAAPRGAPPVRAWLPPRLGLGGVPVPGLAVPSVGRGSPSPVRPAMAGCLGISGPAGRPCSTAPVEIYIHPVPCAGVRQWTVVTVHLSICLYIHTYIHTYIYIYTQVLVDAPGHEIYCSETAVHPPAAGPRATRPDVPLSRRGAPLGVDAGPGGPFWPTANWSIPRLAPSMVTAPGNAPRAHGLPRTGESEFPRPPLPAPALDPNPPNLPRPTGPPLAPPRSPRSAPPSPSAPGAALPGPRPPPPRPRLPALAFSTAALVPPGRARMRWPRATVPVQQRRRRATAPAAWPRDAPTRRPAHRLSHRLSGPRRAPLVRANAPVSGDDSRGKGRAPKVGHLVWSIHLRLPTGRLTARVPRQGRSPG